MFVLVLLRSIIVLTLYLFLPFLLYSLPIHSNPTVTITSPADRTVINPTTQPTFAVSVNAADESGISHVDFFVDEAFVSSVGQPPYTVNIPTSLFGNDPAINLKVIGYDNFFHRTIVTMTVVNAAGVQSPPLTGTKVKTTLD